MSLEHTKIILVNTTPFIPICRNGHVLKVDDKQFLVLSQNGSTFYNVSMEKEDGNIEYTCSCLQFAFRKNMCKHMYASAILVGRMKEIVVSENKLIGKRKLPPGRPRQQRPVRKRKFVE